MNPTPAQLDQLADIILPQTPGFWPPALGWLALGAVILMGILGLFWLMWTRRKAPWWAEAQRKLNALKTRSQATQSDAEQLALLAQVNQLLKQIALTCYGRKQVSALQGEDWLLLLDQGFEHKKTHNAQGLGFSRGPGRLLNQAPYQNQIGLETSVDWQALFKLCETWMRLQSRRYPKLKQTGD